MDKLFAIGGMVHFTLKKKCKHSFLVGFMQIILLLQKVIAGEGQQHGNMKIIIGF